MKAVQEGRLGVNHAALEFGVPKTTLKDRIAGRVVPVHSLCHPQYTDLITAIIINS